MEERALKSVFYHSGEGIKLSTCPGEIMYKFLLCVNSSISPVGMVEIRRAMENSNLSSNQSYTAQKIKFSIKNFFNKCD